MCIEATISATSCLYFTLVVDVKWERDCFVTHKKWKKLIPHLRTKDKKDFLPKTVKVIIKTSFDHLPSIWRDEFILWFRKWFNSPVGIWLFLLKLIQLCGSSLMFSLKPVCFFRTPAFRFSLFEMPLFCLLIRWKWNYVLLLHLAEVDLWLWRLLFVSCL